MNDTVTPVPVVAGCEDCTPSKASPLMIKDWVCGSKEQKDTPVQKDGYIYLALKDDAEGDPAVSDDYSKGLRLQDLIKRLASSTETVSTMTQDPDAKGYTHVFEYKDEKGVATRILGTNGLPHIIRAIPSPLVNPLGEDKLSLDTQPESIDANGNIYINGFQQTYTLKAKDFPILKSTGANVELLVFSSIGQRLLPKPTDFAKANEGLGVQWKPRLKVNGVEVQGTHNDLLNINWIGHNNSSITINANVVTDGSDLVLELDQVWLVAAGSADPAKGYNLNIDIINTNILILANDRF